jgi:hypothetical protein
MNDAELITALRDSFDDVRSATPVETIVNRSRAVRVRRGVSVAAMTAVLGTAAAVGVAVALPTGHSALQPHVTSSSRVQLSAWTLTRQSDGTIRITFHEAADVSGLQRLLRADGVPASVTFIGQKNRACEAVNHPRPGVLGGSRFPKQLLHLFDHPRVTPGPLPSVPPRAEYHSHDALVIRPSTLPTGVGLQIEIAGTPGAADDFQLYVNLVKTSPECTGS